MCECKTEIEAQLLERFKRKHPDAGGHRATLEGYGFAIVNNVMELRPYMPIKFGAGHANKKTGLERWKNEKGTMSFRFCPFCGENMLASQKPPNVNSTAQPAA
jgi:hypothetical protein